MKWLDKAKWQVTVMPKSLIAAVAFLGLIVNAGCSDASKDSAASQPSLVETSGEANSPDSKPAKS
ncbi:MAG: hypothetical protein ACJ8FY_02645, partial [Gemmataceae bacterium]